MPKATLVLTILLVFAMSAANTLTEKTAIYKEIEVTLKHMTQTAQLRQFTWKSNDGISSTLSFEPLQLKKSNKNQLIELIIPQSSNEELIPLLKEVAVLSKNRSWNKLKSCRGIVKVQSNSWATINISDKAINGIIASNYENTIIEMKEAGDTEIYDSRNKSQVEWTCASPKDSEHLPNKAVD